MRVGVPSRGRRRSVGAFGGPRWYASTPMEARVRFSPQVDGVRDRGVRNCPPVKPLAILALTLALVAADAKATLAHLDSLGQPDPYWQQIAAASAARDSQAPLEGAAPLEVFVSSGGLSLLMLGLGVALALDWATAGASMDGARGSDGSRTMSGIAPPGGPAGMREEAIRTVEVLPPSAGGETRFVLRTAAAIVLVALFASVLHASERGIDSGPQARDSSVAGYSTP